MKREYDECTRAVRPAWIAGAALATGVLLAGNGAVWAQQPAASAPAAAPAPPTAAVINAKAVERLN